MEPRAQEQAAVVHGITERQVQGQIVGAGGTLVRGKDHEGIGGAVGRESLKLDLGHGRACAAHVA